MFKFDFKVSNDPTKAFNQFIKEFEQTIDKSLDNIITKSLSDLRQELLDLVNKDIRNVPETVKESAEKEQINIPKSDEEVLKYLTGIDIKDINAKINTKQWHSSSIDSNTVMVNFNKSGRPVVRLKMPIGDSETIDTQYLKAKEFFNKALFVIPQRNGEVEYRLNAGEDLTRDIKIFCSTDRGITDDSKERFQQVSSGQGFAEWTLKIDRLEDFIKSSSAVNLTSVIKNIKNGNFEEATNILKSVSTSNKGKANILNNLADKTTKLQANKDIPPETKLYLDTIQLINKVRIEKHVGEDTNIYSLISDSNLDVLELQKFLDTIHSNLNFWVIQHDQDWNRYISDRIQQLLDKYSA